MLDFEDSWEQLIFDLERLQERAYRLEVGTVDKPIGDGIYGVVTKAKAKSKISILSAPPTI